VKTFALAVQQRPTVVDLWCLPLNTDDPKGVRRFRVINGDWYGAFDPSTGIITVEGIAHSYQGLLIWEGEVPKEESDSYTSAIIWITAEVAAGRVGQIGPWVDSDPTVPGIYAVSICYAPSEGIFPGHATLPDDDPDLESKVG
jgi:hypothetical protein